MGSVAHAQTAKPPVISLRAAPTAAAAAEYGNGSITAQR